MRLCIIIPTFNEEANITNLLKELKLNDCDILVIDDGSEDLTAMLAKNEGAFVISHANKEGKGKSIRDGFDFALKNNYDAVITMDGDGQHSPDDIFKFINCARNFESDIIVGNRMINPKGMPIIRYATNKIMSKIISAFCHQDIPDSQCGFRFITCRVLKDVFLDCSQFEIESEVLIKASKNAYKILSLPVQTIYQTKKSNINPLWDTMRFFKFIFRQLWNLKS
ncbi:MAG: glycosyltransferase family 2 protein [Candidatus Omnitrophota bacterium]|nr:glycosyltransferase family 2 protein [Candidatus Omnitrophota bacterium]